jgi:hypothetical protein
MTDTTIEIPEDDTTMPEDERSRLVRSMGWRLVIVRPGTEVATAQKIRARGYLAMLPMERCRRHRNGRPVWHNELLFGPGYILVYVWSGMEALRKVPNVVRVVSAQIGIGRDERSPLYRKAVATIPQDDIIAWRAQLDDDDYRIHGAKKAGGWKPIDELRAMIDAQ